MKNRLVIVVALALVLSLAIAVPAAAKGGNEVQGKLVVDITYTMTNNYCWSPNVGVWGLMDEWMHVRAWQTGEHSFREEYTMLGRWRTWEGVLSPGAGTPQRHGGSGVVLGSGSLTFNAPGLNPQNGFAVRGYVGTFDVGGRRADMGLPNMFPPGMVSFGSWYFPGTTDLVCVDLVQVYSWGFQAFTQYLPTPGWPPAFAFKGDIVVR
jgi:hypothetical protein